MNQDRYKSRINFSTTIEIGEDRYWVVVTIEDKGIDGFWERMPESIRERCHKSKASVHIIRILAKNLVSAKLYKDFILLGLLKWQSENKEGNYEPKDFIH